MAKRNHAPEVVGFQQEFATVNGTQIHYWIGGDPKGFPVLLWHGFLGTAYSWHKVMPLLAQAGYAVLAPDMRGYGDSDKPSGEEGYDVQALGEEFRALVRQTGFGNGKKLLIAAHDMGAPPALLWAAEQPEECAGVIYMECPAMVGDILSEVIVYKPEQMRTGSMWWWILPLAPGVPERLIVGHERQFLTWFYERYSVDPAAIDEASIQETLRTFSQAEGVLGAMGIYRAAFKSIEQTAKLLQHKATTPLLAIGGEKSLGTRVEQMLKSVASNVAGETISNCGHFIPEEQPREFVRLLQKFADSLYRS